MPSKTVLNTRLENVRGYVQRFCETQSEWFHLPGGSKFPKNPIIAITTFNTGRKMARNTAGLTSRWHDNRHTLITELAESGAGDETIITIAAI